MELEYYLHFVLKAFTYKTHDSHLLTFPLLALSLNLQKFTLWTNRLSNQLALSLKMEFKQLENAVFHFFRKICTYVSIFISVYYFYICVCACMYVLAFGILWLFAKCHNTLCLKATRSRHLFCHVRNTSFAFKHCPGSSSFSFLLIWYLCSALASLMFILTWLVSLRD